MTNTKPTDIQRKWHLIDAKNQVLGRLASNVAQILMGKNKPYYVPYLDCGDFVVVTNAKKVMLTGKKENQKPYYHYSGYPGGLTTQTAASVRSQKPELLIRRAVSGMLPKTKMGKLMIKKLYVFVQSEHPYKEKFKTES